MKRLILLACISLLLGQAKAEKNSGGPLHFHTDGTFKIVQFTDIHAGKDLRRDEPAVETMRMILDEEKPDLVVYTGDIVTENNPRALWEYITEPCRKRSIPFVVTFGNHDSQFDTPRDKLYQLITGLKGCLNLPKKESVEELFGYTNQVIPILANGNNKPASLIYLFDSNSTVDLPGARSEDWIHQNQVAWYKSQSRFYTEANGNTPLPSLAFFHIPLPEFYEAYTNPSYKPIGRRIEPECVSSINSGLFSAFLEQGDVMGVFVGHDHDNDYVGYLYGIALGYGRHTGANYAYRELCRGARIFRLYEGKRNFDTWVRLENYRVIDWKTVHFPSSFLQQKN